MHLDVIFKTVLNAGQCGSSLKAQIYISVKENVEIFKAWQLRN